MCFCGSLYHISRKNKKKKKIRKKIHKKWKEIKWNLIWKILLQIFPFASFSSPSFAVAVFYFILFFFDWCQSNIITFYYDYTSNANEALEKMKRRYKKCLSVLYYTHMMGFKNELYVNDACSNWHLKYHCQKYYFLIAYLCILWTYIQHYVVQFYISLLFHETIVTVSKE